MLNSPPAVITNNATLCIIQRRHCFIRHSGATVVQEVEEQYIYHIFFQPSAILAGWYFPGSVYISRWSSLQVMEAEQTRTRSELAHRETAAKYNATISHMKQLEKKLKRTINKSRLVSPNPSTPTPA